MSEWELFSLGSGEYRNRKREAKDFEKNYTCTDVLHEKRLALHRGVFYIVDYYGESRIRSRELIMIFSAFCRFFKKEILTRLRKTKLCD